MTKYVTVSDLVDEIMRDVPKTDYLEKIEEEMINDAISQLPAALRESVESGAVRYLARKSVNIGGNVFTVPNVAYKYAAAPDRVKARIDVMLELHRAHRAKRADVYRRLHALLETREPVPEFEKYLKGRQITPVGVRLVRPSTVNKDQVLNSLRGLGWDDSLLA